MLKNKKIVVCILIVVLLISIFLIFFLKNNYKISEIGNTMSNKTIKEIEEYILGISSYEAKVSVTIESNKNKNEYVFGQYIDGAAVDGSRLEVKINGGKIFASGTYVYSPVVPASEKNYSDPLNVILKFLEVKSNSTEISDMKMCYIMEKSINATSLYPAYRVTDGNGVNYFFDAVTGERLK